MSVSLSWPLLLLTKISSGRKWDIFPLRRDVRHTHMVFQTKGQIRRSDMSLPGGHRERLGGEFPSFLPQIRRPSTLLMVEPLLVVPEGDSAEPGRACVGRRHELVLPTLKVSLLLW